MCERVCLVCVMVWCARACARVCVCLCNVWRMLDSVFDACVWLYGICSMFVCEVCVECSVWFMTSVVCVVCCVCIGVCMYIYY